MIGIVFQTNPALGNVMRYLSEWAADPRHLYHHRVHPCMYSETFFEGLHLSSAYLWSTVTLRCPAFFNMTLSLSIKNSTPSSFPQPISNTMFPRT